MIGRADIEGSKSNVAMNAWLPQASYPCGNFSDTSGLKLLKHQRIDRPRFHGSYSYWKSESSELLPFCSTRDFRSRWARLRTPALSFDRCAAPAKLPTWHCLRPGSAAQTATFQRQKLGREGLPPPHRIRKKTMKVVVFHRRPRELPPILQLSCLFTKSD